MPKYDYLCPENGEVIEVSHRMSESISTWAELCQKAGRELGSTPAQASVQKQISAPVVNTPKVGEWKRKPGYR